MKTTKFLKGGVIVGSTLLIVGLCVAAYKMYSPFLPVQEDASEHTRSPTFVWKYEDSDILNLDGFPETNVYLEARYSQGKVEKIFIDRTAAGCNDVPDADTDSVPGSTTILCYGAGLGYRFKITKGEGVYLVQRKKIEESSPEYSAPVYAYEIVLELPLH